MSEKFYFGIQDGIAECWASGPTLEVAESRVREHVTEFVANHPEEGPIRRWRFKPSLPPITDEYLKWAGRK